MTLQKVKVLLRWLSKKEGGKEVLPHGAQYSTVAKFKKIKNKWPEEAWSIVLKIDPSKYRGRKLRAEMQMLSKEAPQELLGNGEEFELYEGYNLVAHGKIL